MLLPAFTILKPVGLRGLLSVSCFLKDCSLVRDKPLFVDIKKEPMFIEKMYLMSGKVTRIKIKDLDNRDMVLPFKNTILKIDRSCLPELPDEEFYCCDLKGRDTFLSDGSFFGTISEVADYGAGLLVFINTKNEKTEVWPINSDIFPCKLQLNSKIFVNPPEFI